jgi:hypothetical protein
MSDQTLEQHDDGQHDDDVEQDGGKNLDDKPIPYSRFEEVNKRAKKAEQELQELRDRILDFEDRDKSEAERDKARAERAERELSQMMQKVTGLEKGLVGPVRCRRVELSRSRGCGVASDAESCRVRGSARREACCAAARTVKEASCPR